ncbi:DUF4998 domain-containing protein [Tamlana agarivorans]|uniref:DUF4998 domain-containing protein n=1 Tax=Pseudotamlana agarivorans TaxID=481183 RepID=A0ACC5U9B4_9FLAO|nr:DUF4998 domain-containing protein [Tamlana agarivorans]MBU2950922.1 DUF4998 domain-containing protein [Tamlana agarivorans]
MITKNIKSFTNTALFAVLVTSFFSCSTDLYETFDQYVPDKVVSVSVGEPTVLAGDEKVVMVVEISADPKLKRGVVTSIDGEVQYVFEIDRTVFKPELIPVEYEAEEGIENLIVYMEDVNGVKSLDVEVYVDVLGENYRASLLNREIDAITVNSQTELTINWISNKEQTIVNGEVVYIIKEPLLLETTFTYTDSSGVDQTIVFDSTVDEIIIDDFLLGSDYSYTSSYKAFDENQPPLDIYQLSLTPDVFITDATVGTFPI